MPLGCYLLNQRDGVKHVGIFKVCARNHHYLRPGGHTVVCRTAIEFATGGNARHMRAMRLACAVNARAKYLGLRTEQLALRLGQIPHGGNSARVVRYSESGVGKLETLVQNTNQHVLTREWRFQIFALVHLVYV